MDYKERTNKDGTTIENNIDKDASAIQPVGGAFTFANGKFSCDKAATKDSQSRTEDMAKDSTSSHPSDILRIKCKRLTNCGTKCVSCIDTTKEGLVLLYEWDGYL